MASPSIKVPEPTLSRLSLYIRCLRQLAKDGVKTTSSAQMEAHCGIVPAQIRKDLSHFGEFGKPGTGYNVQHLLGRLTEIMQLDRERRIAIVGAGNLGAALAGYAGFAHSPFRIVGIFDNNLNKIGRMLWSFEILDIQRLADINQHMHADLGIIAVPAEAAQEVADRLVEAGIRAILNFAPALIDAPAGAAVRNVDLTREIEVLCYHVPRVSAPQQNAPEDSAQ
ncbi:MAG: redox-sensing transcriptional repressor Rex [Armatimonadetes bacterium]|nr:redox-sensing transcriptional repressor Rex [Armatimonadota bacterium]